MTNLEKIIKVGYMVRIAKGRFTTVGKTYKVLEVIDNRTIIYIRDSGVQGRVTGSPQFWKPSEPILNIEGI